MELTLGLKVIITEKEGFGGVKAVFTLYKTTKKNRSQLRQWNGKGMEQWALD